MIKKLKRLLCKLIFIEGSQGHFRWLPDKLYLQAVYFAIFNKQLNLNNPSSYNEKLQWLKLYDRRPEYTMMVDKYAVKDYVAAKVGIEYIIKTLGVWNSFDEIDFTKLPNQFVLKCTHDSGGLIICKDKKNLDMDIVKKKINKCLKKNFYYSWREWPYKNVKPRIIAEEYMIDNDDQNLKDYKFFVFNGRVEYLFVATDRQAKTDTCFDFFDRRFNHIKVRNGHPNAKKIISKPEGFEKMIELAEKLGKGIPHCRIDLYNINGRIYFGEITFFHFSGFVPFDPPEWDEKFGAYLKIYNNV